jgi:hypothetical protein
MLPSFFIILSGRTIFYKELIVDNLINTHHTLCNNEIIDNTNKWNLHLNNWNPPPYPDWHWKTFHTTLLAKYYLNNNKKLYAADHEGLTFSYNVTQNILFFLSNHSDILADLIQTNHCVEEFALQSIAFNEIDKNNLEFGYMRLVNGMYCNFDINLPNRYLCKIEFSSTIKDFQII